MVVMALLHWLQLQVLLRLRSKLSIGNSARFLWHVLHLPLSFHNQRAAGEIANRMTLNDSVADALANDLVRSLLAIMTVVFYTGLMVFFDPVLTAVAMGIAGLNLLALQAVARRRRDGRLRSDVRRRPRIHTVRRAPPRRIRRRYERLQRQCIRGHHVPPRPEDGRKGVRLRTH